MAIGTEPIKKEPPLDRVISDAFFPSSPAATTREAIFSDFLAEILGAKPLGKDISQLEGEFSNLDYLKEFPEETKLLWSAFVSTYTITGERGARGKDPKRYVVPFHPEIAKTLKPKESRPFGKWYIMLMSTGNPPVFNTKLHTKFVDRLKDLNPSNLLEKIAIEAAKAVGFEKVSELDTSPVRPYLEQLSIHFQEDLEGWIDHDIESPSRWLQGVSDLLSFYMMMLIIQFSKNVHQEFDAVKDNRPYRAEIIPIYFGEWEEAASQNRDFSHAWEGRNGLEREIFDSWGRLVVLRIISETLRSNGWPGYSVTLSEAAEITDMDMQRLIIQQLSNALLSFNQKTDADTLGILSQKLASAVTKHYEGKQISLHSPTTMGVNVVIQLGTGSSRQFLRRQKRVGTTFRLNTPAIIFFAKLFYIQKSLSGSYDGFIRFLLARGMQLDDESKIELLKRLEALGMIEKQSDSGESIYVRAL